MKVNLIGVVTAIALCIVSGAASPQAQETRSPVDEMRQLMLKTWDRPEAPLRVEPVVIEEDAAVAGWTQDTRGGRALFRKRGGHWVMMLCAGSALRTAAGLRATGLSAALAEKLAAQVVEAEGRLPAALVKAFDSFEGTVMMEDHAHPRH